MAGKTSTTQLGVCREERGRELTDEQIWDREPSHRRCSGGPDLHLAIPFTANIRSEVPRRHDCIKGVLDASDVHGAGSSRCKVLELCDAKLSAMEYTGVLYL